jgi:hypothetical protein
VLLQTDRKNDTRTVLAAGGNYSIYNLLNCQLWSCGLLWLYQHRHYIKTSFCVNNELASLRKKKLAMDNDPLHPDYIYELLEMNGFPTVSEIFPRKFSAGLGRRLFIPSRTRDWKNVGKLKNP